MSQKSRLGCTVSEKLNTSRILEPSPSPRPQVQATWFLVTYIWTWKAESWWFQWISFFPAYHLTIGTGKIWTKTLLVFVTLPIIFRFAINIFPAIPVKIRYCEKATKIWPIFLVSFEPTKGQKGPKQIFKPSILPKNKWTNIFLSDYSSGQKKSLSFGRIDGLAICFWKFLNLMSNKKLKMNQIFVAFSEYLNFTCSSVLFLMELNPWTAMAFESKFFIRSTEFDKANTLLITKNCIKFFLRLSVEVDKLGKIQIWQHSRSIFNVKHHLNLFH